MCYCVGVTIKQQTIMDITFKKTVNFLGRNGMFKQTGMAIDLVEREFKDKTTSTIELEPFTSRGVIGRAMLEIPLEDVPSVIAALLKVAKLSPLPLTSGVILTEEQWAKTESLISDAIEFGEQLVGNDESETLTDLKKREKYINSI